MSLCPVELEIRTREGGPTASLRAGSQGELKTMSKGHKFLNTVAHFACECGSEDKQQQQLAIWRPVSLHLKDRANQFAPTR